MQIDSLETRVMLSSTLTSRGTLVVTGDAGDDSIIVSRDPVSADKILAVVNGVGVQYDSLSVKRIVVDGAAGNDQLHLDDSLAVISRRGATLIGGEGNDTLIGGFAAATFGGGSGHDSITGTSSNDTITGGDGNDTIVGGGGFDFIQGGAGADLIAGGRGDDLLYGDAGNDTLYGQDGHDTLGGDGEDRIQIDNEPRYAATPGNDLLNGGHGNDWITGGNESRSRHDENNGKDTLIGGAGNDILDSRGWNRNSNNPFDVILDREAGDIVPMQNYTRPATAAELKLGDKAFDHWYRARIFVNLLDKGFIKDAVIDGGIGDFVDPNRTDTFSRMYIGMNAPNEIQMRDLDPRGYTLGEFFRNWGITFSKTHIGRYVVSGGRTLSFYVKRSDSGKGRLITDPYNYVIRPSSDLSTGDHIIITYA